MKCKFAELHNPLFHGGKNHGMKLLAKDGLDIEYSKEEKELTVIYKGEPTYLPSTSVQNYTPVSQVAAAVPVAQEVVNKSHPQDTRKIKSAQVSTPHGHVFQGEGAGVVRDRK